MWRRLLVCGVSATFAFGVIAMASNTGEAGASGAAPRSASYKTHALTLPEPSLLPPVDAVDAATAAALPDVPSAGRLRVLPSDPIHRTIAWLGIVAEDNENVFCSGTIVGHGVVLTAAHCISGAKSVRVVPGKDGASEPWGSQFGSAVSVPSGWGFGAPGDYAKYDIGLVILPDRKLTDKTGIFPGKLAVLPAGLFKNNATEVAALGYPGDCSDTRCSKDFPAAAPYGMYTWALHAGFVKADESFIYPDFPGAPGISGAAVIRESDMAIVGVVDSSLFITTQGVRFNESAKDFVTLGCGSFPVCSVAYARPLLRLSVPGVAADTHEVPLLTGLALYCGREVAFVDAFTETEIKFAHSFGNVLSVDVNPALFLDPNLKALFAQQVGAAVADALAVKALESPDSRFDAFHTSLDGGIDDIMAGLGHMNEAIGSGSMVSMLAAISALGEANLHIMAAQAQYPSIDPVCLP